MAPKHSSQDSSRNRGRNESGGTELGEFTQGRRGHARHPADHLASVQIVATLPATAPAPIEDKGMDRQLARMGAVDRDDTPLRSSPATCPLTACSAARHPRASRSCWARTRTRRRKQKSAVCSTTPRWTGPRRGGSRPNSAAWRFRVEIPRTRPQTLIMALFAEIPVAGSLIDGFWSRRPASVAGNGLRDPLPMILW